MAVVAHLRIVQRWWFAPAMLTAMLAFRLGILPARKCEPVARWLVDRALRFEVGQ